MNRKELAHLQAEIERFDRLADEGYAKAQEMDDRNQHEAESFRFDAYGWRMCAAALSDFRREMGYPKP